MTEQEREMRSILRENGILEDMIGSGSPLLDLAPMCDTMRAIRETDYERWARAVGPENAARFGRPEDPK